MMPQKGAFPMVPLHLVEYVCSFARIKYPTLNHCSKCVQNIRWWPTNSIKPGCLEHNFLFARNVRGEKKDFLLKDAHAVMHKAFLLRMTAKSAKMSAEASSKCLLACRPLATRHLGQRAEQKQDIWNVLVICSFILAFNEKKKCEGRQNGLYICPVLYGYRVLS